MSSSTLSLPRLAGIVLAAACCLLIAATSANAATSTYHPTPQARDFTGGAGSWSAAGNTYSGLCLLTGVAACPSGSTTHITTDSNGHLRTSFGVVLGTLAGSTTTHFLSPWFTYNGAGGTPAESLTVSWRQRAALGSLLSLGGVSSNNRIVLERNGGGTVIVRDTSGVANAPNWVENNLSISNPGALTIGDQYRFVISTSLSVPLLGLVASGTIDYDDVRLVAENASTGGPDIVSPPFVVGDPELGSILSCNPGTWNPAPDSFEYRWYRDGQLIEGATGPNYTVVEDDLGKSISCAVRPVIDGIPGDWTDPTDPTDPVTDPEADTPENSTPPSIIPGGTPMVGDLIECDPGTWTPTPDAFEFRWYRDGELVATSTNGSYVVSEADVGQQLSCSVRAQLNGSWSDWTPQTPAVVPADNAVDVPTVTKQLKAGIGKRAIVKKNNKNVKVMRIRCPKAIAPDRCKTLKVEVLKKRSGGRLTSTKKFSAKANQKKSPKVKGKKAKLAKYSRKSAFVRVRLVIPGQKTITVTKKARIKRR